MAASDLVLEGFDEQDGIELVQKLPLFRSLTFDETRRLFSVAHQEVRRGGDVIVEIDAVGQALYIVKRGRVQVVRDGAVLGVLSAGELFGEMSLVDDLFTSAQVIAEGEVELIVLPRRPFEQLLAGDTGLALKVYKAFCRVLSDRLRHANAHVQPDARPARGDA